MALNQQIHLAAIAALEDAENQAQVVRSFHHRDDPFVNLSDGHFVRLYRLNKVAVRHLIGILEPFLPIQSRQSALDVQSKVLIALRFFASGSYQLDIASNIHAAVSQASVRKAITEVTDAMNRPEIFNKYVKFPANIEELQRKRSEFYQNHRFPGVIGCIDCTHVAIYPPKKDDAVYPEELYVNRKGYHSINVQLICDSSLRILNVLARYPGSTNDSFIWNSSNVLPVLRTLHAQGHNSFYLLGDSGYPLRPWLLTPIANVVPNSPEEAYNERHMSTRSIIERCNGVLKLRFRCLLKHRVLHYTPERASKIINACVILHNMCIDNNIPDVGFELDDIDTDFGLINIQDNAANIINPELAAGRRLQQYIVAHNFRL